MEERLDMETYVCRDWKPRNEITTPLKGTPEYHNSGIIKAVTETGEKIQVGRITYESFENEEFQYIITPFWEMIDTLSARVFQGIPGIDMDLRLEHYYRVNYEPVFITERTPGRNREDLWELLDSVGLDYYDRLEWLIRTDLRAAVDNLIVERARDEKKQFAVTERKQWVEVLEQCQYGDEILVESMKMVGVNSYECTRMLNRLMHYGVRLVVREEGVNMGVQEYKSMLPVLSAMARMDRESRRASQEVGIRRAKSEGVYRGRSRKETEEFQLEEVIKRFRKKEISLEEALQLTGFSRSTFYRRMKEKEERQGYRYE